MCVCVCVCMCLRARPGSLHEHMTSVHAMRALFAHPQSNHTQYNTLNRTLPVPDTLNGRLLRAAGIGFCAGVVSDAASNRRVLACVCVCVCVCVSPQLAGCRRAQAARAVWPCAACIAAKSLCVHSRQLLPPPPPHTHTHHTHRVRRQCARDQDQPPDGAAQHQLL
jgi:hypothetical protein